MKLEFFSLVPNTPYVRSKNYKYKRLVAELGRHRGRYVHLPLKEYIHTYLTKKFGEDKTKSYMQNKTFMEYAASQIH